MLKLRDIMTRDVVTVAPDLSIRDAMELLTQRGIGGVPVVAGRDVVGVISLSDLVQFTASLPAESRERPDEAEDDATDSPADGAGDPDAAFFAEMWSDEATEAVERFDSISAPELNALADHTVSEAMTRGARTMRPDADALEAAALMTGERIHRIVVMDGDQLVGIVSLTDIAKAAAEHRLSTRTYVFPR